MIKKTLMLVFLSLFLCLSTSEAKSMKIIRFEKGDNFNNLSHPDVKANLSEKYVKKEDDASCKVDYCKGEGWISHELTSKIDWHEFTKIKFDAYSTAEKEIEMFFIVADEHWKKTASNEDKCHLKFILKPGENSVSLDIKDMKSKEDRKLDKEHILKVMIYTKDAPEEFSVYYSDLKLATE